MKPFPYTLTELIQNDDFIAWVLHPDESNTTRWDEYILAYPNKGPLIEDAKKYVVLLAQDTGRHPPTQEQRTKMWRVVEAFIDSET